MQITSSYKVKIVSTNINLNDTVSIYRKALTFIIGVANDNFDTLKNINGNLKQQRFIEKLIHGTKGNEAKYSEFDKQFYKYPTYLRRATITAAIGAVLSYRSNLANWENSGKKGESPSLQVNHKTLPTFFRDNMYLVKGAPVKSELSKVTIAASKDVKSLSDSERIARAEALKAQKLEYSQKELAALAEHQTVYLKVYHNNDWVWATVKLRKTDIAYLRRYWSHTSASAPVLEKRFGKYSLRFAFEENVSLSKTPTEEQRICAVDLGLNTDAVCSIMTVDGTVLARKFINFPCEKDHLYRVLNQIKKFQRLHGSREARNFWAYAKRINNDLSVKIANGIVEFAFLHSADVIVFEHLNFKSKKAKGSKKQKIQMWRKNGIQHFVEHKAHRCGIRISHICAWGTSKYAYDGSGELTRDENNHALATFASGKHYNADLSASYNIGARYFIRELIKSMSKKTMSQCQAKVPDIGCRTKCTLNTLKQLSLCMDAIQKEKTAA